MCRYSHHDRWASWDSPDPTSRARCRARAITEALNRALAPGSLQADMAARIAQGDREAWAIHVDPAGGWRETTNPSGGMTPPEAGPPDGFVSARKDHEGRFQG